MAIEAIRRGEGGLLKAREEQLDVINSFRDTAMRIYAISSPLHQERALRRVQADYARVQQKVEDAKRALYTIRKAYQIPSVVEKPDLMYKEDLDYARAEWLRGCDLIKETCRLLEDQKMKCIKELDDLPLFETYVATFNGCCAAFKNNETLFEIYYENLMLFSKRNPRRSDLEIATYLIDVKKHISLRKSVDLMSKQYQAMKTLWVKK